MMEATARFLGGPIEGDTLNVHDPPPYCIEVPRSPPDIAVCAEEGETIPIHEIETYRYRMFRKAGPGEYIYIIDGKEE